MKLRIIILVGTPSCLLVSWLTRPRRVLRRIESVLDRTGRPMTRYDLALSADLRPQHVSQALNLVTSRVNGRIVVQHAEDPFEPEMYALRAALV